MGLTLRPTGLGSPVDKDRGITTSSVANLPWAGFMKSAARPRISSGSGRSPAFLARHRTRMDGHAPTLESTKAQLGEAGMGKS
jgi:hypothetical protein